MKTRRRGISLYEVVFSIALAGLLVGIHCDEVLRQQGELRLVSREAQARDALLDAYERLRGGLLAAPGGNEPRRLDAPAEVALSIQRLPAPGELPAGLAAVRLRVVWTAAPGEERERVLTTLAVAGEGR